MSENLQKLKNLTDKLTLRDDKLRETQHILDNFFNISNDLLCVLNFNEENRFLKLNQSWVKVLGFTRKEIKSLKFNNLVHRDDLNIILEKIADLFNNKKPILNFTIRMLCKDDSYKTFKWKCMPYNNKNILCAIIKNIKK